MKNKVLLGFALLGALALVAGCANKQGETEAPVFITIDLPLQPLVIDVNNPVPLQIQTINLASHFKNPTATDPQHFADVEISYYTVTFLRLDGGTLLPKTETFAANVLIDWASTLAEATRGEEYLSALGTLFIYGGLNQDYARKGLSVALPTAITSQADSDHWNRNFMAETALFETWTRDPFDLMIVSHAKANNYSILVTQDEKIRKHYPKAVW